MPVRDKFHEIVKIALIKDGWEITADPYKLKWGFETLYADLGAEKAIAAEKDNQKIAVEIKSFIGKSETAELQKAIGQYVLYQILMSKQDPERMLFLAVPEKVYLETFEGLKGEILIGDAKLKVFGYSTWKT
jgi:hypothetical protein